MVLWVNKIIYKNITIFLCNFIVWSSWIKKKQHKLHILVSYSKSEKKHVLLWLVIPITNLSPQMESKYKRAFCKYVLHWPYSKINTLSSSCRWLRKIRPKIFISAKSKICTTNKLKKKRRRMKDIPHKGRYPIKSKALLRSMVWALESF